MTGRLRVIMSHPGMKFRPGTANTRIGWYGVVPPDAFIGDRWGQVCVRICATQASKFRSEPTYTVKALLRPLSILTPLL